MDFNDSSIETYTGKSLDVLDPQLEDIAIDDIAISLSRLCRFNGHTAECYTVAQHSVMVSHLMQVKVGDYLEPCLWGLLHDAPEAYIGDIPRPVKKQFDGVKQMENNLMRVIAQKLGIPFPCPWEEVLKVCDNRALLCEAKTLMVSGGEGYNLDPPVEGPPSCFRLKNSGKAYVLDDALADFLDRYYECLEMPRLNRVSVDGYNVTDLAYPESSTSSTLDEQS